MNRTPKKSVLVIETVIAILLAVYILFPFYMDKMHKPWYHKRKVH